MKPIVEHLTVSDLIVKVTATPDITRHPHVIQYEGVCGKTRRVSSMPLPARHDRLPEHLDKDHDDWIRKFAEEVAGYERSRLHLEEKFKD